MVEGGQQVQSVTSEDVVTEAKQVVEQTIQVEASDASAVNETALRHELAALYEVPVAAIVLSHSDEGLAAAANNRRLWAMFAWCFDAGVFNHDKCLELTQAKNEIRPESIGGGHRQLASTLSFVVRIDVSYLEQSSLLPALLPNSTTNASSPDRLTATLNALWAGNATVDRLTAALGDGVTVSQAAAACIITQTFNSTRRVERFVTVNCRPGYWGSDNKCVPCMPGTYDPGNGNTTECNDCLGESSGHRFEADPARSIGVGTDVLHIPVLLLLAGGTYQPRRNATTCLRCVVGHYCSPGASVPVACNGGSYSSATNLESATECTPCPPGSACSTSSTDPSPCAPGTFAADFGASQCTACLGGTFTGTDNSTACRGCPVGNVCVNRSSAPLPCPAGRFGASAMSSFDECRICPPATWCSVGASEPTNCSAGTHSPLPERKACDACAVGHFSPEGSTNCTKCEQGKYAASAGQGMCIPCPHRLSSPEGAGSCSVCDEHYYLVNDDVDRSELMAKPDTYCDECPDHDKLSTAELSERCPFNTTLMTLVVPRDHWRLSLLSQKISKCEAHNCQGGMDAGIHGEGYCAEGRTGPKCFLCQKGKGLYNDADTGECLPCPDAGGAIARAVGVAIAFLAAVAIIVVALAHPMCQERVRVLRRLRHSIDRLMTYVKSTGLQCKLKILFSFYGIATVLNSTYDAKLPPAYTDWVDKVFKWAKMDWGALVLPSECSPISSAGSSFRCWLLIKTIVPLVVIFLATVGGTIVKCTKLGWSPKNLYNGTLASLPLALVVSFCLVPSVSSSIFHSWLCNEYQYDDRPVFVDGRLARRKALTHEYLQKDLSVRCSGGGFTGDEYETITTRSRSPSSSCGPRACSPCTWPSWHRADGHSARTCRRRSCAPPSSCTATTRLTSTIGSCSSSAGGLSSSAGCCSSRQRRPSSASYWRCSSPSPLSRCC